MDLCLILSATLVLTLIVTVVGHLLWLFFASLFRGATSKSATPPQPQTPWSQSRMAELAFTARQIDQLFANGRINVATHREITEAIQRERARALGEDVPPRVAMPLTPPSAPPQERPPAAMPPSMAPAPPQPAFKPLFPPVEDVRPPAPAPASVRPTPPVPIAPRPPRRPLAEVLAAFMEEKNIRWGDLIGGLLIVGFSTALVVSLWAKIAAIPFLKFFIFTAVTAALYGAGLYTEHRWKLPTTSRGVLIIASLLVPLNFLAIAAFSEGAASGGGSVSGEVLALIVFAALAYLAGKVITPQWPMALAVGVVGAAAWQLFIRRFIGPETGTLRLLGFGAEPVGVYVATAGWVLWRMVRSGAGSPRDPACTAETSSLSRTQANTVFTLLGLTSLAALVPLGLLVFKSGDISNALRQIAALIALLGVPALAIGVFLWQRITDKELSLMRTTGTAIAVLGALVMLGALAPAWPQASSLVPIATLDAVLFAALALALDLPVAHWPAGLCMVLAYLVGYHALSGNVDWNDDHAAPMIAALVGPASGPALVPLVAALTGVFSALTRWGRRRHGLAYAAITAAAIVLSLVLVTRHGLGQRVDHGATWVYALYALAAFAGALTVRRAAPSWAGAILLLAALVQGFVYRYRGVWGSDNPALALQVALLSHASIGVAVAIAVRLFVAKSRVAGDLAGGQDARPPIGPDTRATHIQMLLANPLLSAGLVVSILTILLLPVGFPVRHSGEEAARLFWLAGVWVAMAFLFDRSLLMTAAQVALTLAVPLAVIAHLSSELWFKASYKPVLHPRTIQAMGLALAGLSAVWLTLRLMVRTTERAAPRVLGRIRTYLNPPWPSVDRIVAFGVLGGLIVLVLAGLTAGIDEEFAHASVAPEQGPAHVNEHAVLALGGGSWTLMFVLAGLFVASLWDRYRNRVVLALVLTLATACPLIAGRWLGHDATASSLRWCLGVFWLAISAAIWARGPILRAVTPLRWPELAERKTLLPFETRALLIVLAIAPILCITIMRVMVSLAGSTLAGPLAGGFFERIGESVSYGVPLLLISAGLIGHGLRERSAGYTFAAGLVISLTVTLAWLMAAATGHRTIGTPELVELLQFNAITVAAYALAWLGARYVLWRRANPAAINAPPRLLDVQVSIALLLNLLMIAPTACALVADPAGPMPLIAAVGSKWGWLSLVLAIAAAGALGYVKRFAVPPAGSVCFGGLSVACMVAFGVARRDTRHWEAYHALLVGAAATAWLTLLIGWVAQRWTSSAKPASTPASTPPAPEPPPMTTWQSWIRWTLFGSALALLLALRGVSEDPGRPWWTVAVVVSLSVLSSVLAVVTVQERYLACSGILFNLAASIAWITQRWSGWPDGAAAYVEFAEINALALLVPSAASLTLRLRGWLRSPVGRLAFHEVAAVLATFVVTAAAVVGLGCDAQHHPIHPALAIGWLAWTAAALVAIACLLDRYAEPSWPLIYLLGLTAIGLGLDPLDLRGRWLSWSGAVALSLYTLATATLYGYVPRKWLTGVIERARGRCAVALTAPEELPARSPAARWLVPAKKALSCVVVILAIWVALNFGPALLRLSAAQALILRAAISMAVAVHALGIGILAQALDRLDLRRITLLLIAAAIVLLGWTPLNPDAPGVGTLDRPVIIVAGVVAAAAFYALFVPQRLGQASPWIRAAGHALAILAVIGTCTLAAILGSEGIHTANGESVSMSLAAAIGLVLVLAGAAAVAIMLALDPSRDPLRLSEKGRMGYVYGAEGLVAIAVIHLRLSMPWLFQDFFAQFWPVIVMAISFVGVGLAEIFRRQGRRVLADPLEATGIFLPLLPAIGFWIGQFNSKVDYSLQLLTIGALYAILAVRRKSFGLGLMAALSGNGALWYFLAHTDSLGLLQHPQIWLIPPALSLLAATHLNRGRLSAEQLTTLRYIAMSTIYVSSTADIFVNGVREAPWLPLVLAVLSVGGVFMGIVLRIRSFLFLGSAFLLLSIITMIRYATLNFGWTWLWYVAGILLGVAILVIFGLFEKKRAQMVGLIEDLKRWQA